VIIRVGKAVAIAESAARRWRIYQLSPMGTPFSLLGGDEGLPGTRQQYPLEPVSQSVQELAVALHINSSYLVVALRAASR
jgi:hypothetical protein